MAHTPQTEVNVTALNGNFREQYADKLENLTPARAVIQRDIEFVPRQQQPGNQYHQPVLLAHEHGFTYAAAGSGAFELENAIAGQTKDATLVGTQMLLRSRIDYETAARASSGPPRNFKQALSIVVENMWESSRKRAEIDLLYGQRGIGQINTSGVNTTNGTIEIATAEWAPAIWAGQEGAKLGTYSQITSTATLTCGASYLQITGVDLENKTITVTGTLTNVTGGNYCFFKTQRTTTAHNVFQGIHSLLASTGTVLGISTADYSLWKANTYAVGGALTFNKIQKAIASAVAKGLDEDLNLYINPSAWADLLSDEAALRRHVKGGREAAYMAGAEGIQFFSQNGKITIKPTPFMKEGIAIALAPRYWKRVGATDLTFRLPDRSDEFFLHVPTHAAYELRCYINHAIITRAPGRAILLTGIVNST